MIRLDICFPVLAALLGFSVLAWWNVGPLRLSITPRRAKPAAETRAVPAEPAPEAPLAGGGAYKSFNQPTPVPAGGSWPRFRGPDFDNIATVETPLRTKWQEAGPPRLWSVELGEGYAGPAVHKGRVYVLDYDLERRGDLLRCFRFDNGEELWQRFYSVRIRRNHGMSRTVPAVTDRYVVTMGPKCHVMAVRADDGSFLWGKDLVGEYETKVPLWYTGQCPLIDDGIAVLAPGGTALLTGIDCETGEVVWETPNPNNWGMSHASVMPMTFAGKRMYVYTAIGGIVGVSAEAADRGTVLWETTAWDHAVIAPSPVCFPDGRIFLTAGYGVGSMMLQLSRNANGFIAEPVYTKTKEEFACEQQTPIRFQDHLFTILPKDAGGKRQQFACMRSTGEVLWTSGKTERFGLGPYLCTGDYFLILDDRGTLTMTAAETGRYRKLASAKVLDGHDAWAPLALVDGRLLLRDFNTMVCLDLRKQPGAQQN